MSTKLKSNKVQKGKRLRIVGPELSVLGRNTKDRSAHETDTENFRSVGDYYAFHDNILRDVSKKNANKKSSRLLKRYEKKVSMLKSKNSDIETKQVEIESAEEKKEPSAVFNLSTLEEAKVEVEAEGQVAQAPQVINKDPGPETKTIEVAENDDFIPISVSAPTSYPDFLLERLVIRTCMTELIRKRSELKQNKSVQHVIMPKKTKGRGKNRPKKMKKTATLDASIENSGEKVVAHSSIDSNAAMSLDYEEYFAIAYLSEGDFEFPKGKLKIDSNSTNFFR